MWYGRNKNSGLKPNASDLKAAAEFGKQMM